MLRSGSGIPVMSGRRLFAGRPLCCSTALVISCLAAVAGQVVSPGASASLPGKTSRFRPTAPYNDQQVVALYHFDEGKGERVRDFSSSKNDGTVIGGATWSKGIRGSALLLDGQNRVRIPSAPVLDRHGPLSVSAWIRGRASGLRLIEGYPKFRGPWFQVCGDRIYLAANTDERPEATKVQKVQDWKIQEWHDAWHLWTGTADINLTDWRYTQRTQEPFSALEPKFQVVGNKIYYEYFGQDRNKAWQIWTAESDVDGSGWSSTQRTQESQGYRVEQDDNLQVVGDSVYIGFPQMDEQDHWQLWTASFRRDGSQYTPSQRTTQGGWIPSLQVVEDKIYYMYPVAFQEKNVNDPERYRYELYMAVSRRDGTGWRVLKKLGNGNFGGGGWGSFQVNDGYIYLAYVQEDRAEGGQTRLFTGRMDTAGTHLEVSRRTVPTGYAGVPNGSLKVIGDKVNLVFDVWETNQEMADVFSDLDRFERQTGTHTTSLWTAEANLDGSGWQARRRVAGPPDIIWAYKGLQVVGAKSYMGAWRLRSAWDWQGLLGVAGSNIVSKGDAYGIGVTENGLARGFINAGEDYLFRAEAPSNIAGATAEAAIDGNWHHLVMTYDKRDVRLYVDGQLRATTPYAAPAGRNPFPVLIGDGFQGKIDEVTIYSHALSQEEVTSEFARLRP
jgi:hypothetical protein